MSCLSQIVADRRMLQIAEIEISQIAKLRSHISDLTLRKTDRRPPRTHHRHPTATHPPRPYVGIIRCSEKNQMPYSVVNAFSDQYECMLLSFEGEPTTWII